MKATIIRKASNAVGWRKDAAEIKNRLGAEFKEVEVIVEKIITLSKEEFDNFNNDYFENRKFITDNLEKMYVDKDKIWHCIQITTQDTDFSVLVESEGYDYARYTAIILN